jgi:hypothetical protein
MVHEFKAGDWAVGDDGERLFLVGSSHGGNLVCQTAAGTLVYTGLMDITLLPDCTGWDWVAPAPAPLAPAAPEPTSYRLLSYGEKIQAGDEYFSTFQTPKWKSVEGSVNHMFSGAHNPIRRAITPEPHIGFESQSNPVYVISTAERDEWLRATDLDYVATSTDCEELIPCGSVPAGRLFLLPDEFHAIAATVYRLLCHGELIRFGDELWQETGWTKVIPSMISFPVFQGCIPLRRKITG